MARQLIVHDDNEVAEECIKAVETALGGKADVMPVRNIERAQAQIDSPDREWSLVVIGAGTPESADSKRNTGDFAPVHEFIRKLKFRQPNLPIIALATTPEPALAGLLSAYKDTALIAFEADWRATLTKRASELEFHVQPEASRLTLEITLQSPRAASWRLECNGRIESAASGSLHLNDRLFNELLGSSEAMASSVEGSTWMTGLDEMAAKLKKLLFHGSKENMELWETFTSQRAAAGGIENLRLIFTMSPSMQPVIVEALKDAPGADAFWVLKAPIIRQYNFAGAKQPLFRDEKSMRGPINCLIIDADPAPGSIDDGLWSGNLAVLTEVRKEASDIVKILADATAVAGIGRIERLQLKRGDELIPTVLECLDHGPWHLVHFAGHAVINARKEPGLVLASYSGGVLPFAAVAAKLFQTQFLFLSSCQTANPSFLLKAIANVVPAVVGYRWRVQDFSAMQFATAFYRALFNRKGASFKSLEYAFLNARQDAFRIRPDNATWVSPLLLTQLERRHGDKSPRLH